MTGPLVPSLPPLAIADPGRTVLHRALRVALVTPLLFAFGLLVLRDGQFALLACFGSFAALAMADFTGPRVSRLRAYGALGALGVVLVSGGTLLSQTLMPAVVAMFAVAVVFQFLMVLGGQFALGNNAVILAFVIAVMVPGDAATVPSRVAGWIVAVVVSALAASFLWPRHERRDLHASVAASARTLAGTLRAVARQAAGAPAQKVAAQGDWAPALALSDAAIARLREAQAAVGFRPLGPPEHQRALLGLVDALVQSSRFAHVLPTVGSEAANAALCTSLAGTLEAVAAVTEAAIDDAPGPAVPIEALARARHAHREHMEAAARAAMARGEAGIAVVRLACDAFPLRVLSYQVLGMAVDAQVMARRSVAVHDDFASPEPQAPSTVRERWRDALLPQLTLSGVWMRNCLRAGVALALAVLVARVSDIGHAFWVVLATLAVLRGNASTTRATIVSALVGALCGLVLATLAMLVLGGHALGLWLALPFVVFLAGYAPAAISFGAGQAMFALLVVVLFNLIVPEGWEVGVVRVEAVALGAAVALVASLIMWPRGAAAALRAEIAASVRAGNRFLAQALRALAGDAHEVGRDRAEALATRERVDVAMAAFMGERGAKPVPLVTWMALARVPIVLRFAGDAAIALRQAQPAGRAEDAVAHRFDAAVAVVERGFTDLADRLDGGVVTDDAALAAALTDLAATPPVSERRNALHAALGAWLDAHRNEPGALPRTMALTWGVGWLGYLARLRLGVEAALAQVVRPAGTQETMHAQA